MGKVMTQHGMLRREDKAESGASLSFTKAFKLALDPDRVLWSHTSQLLWHSLHPKQRAAEEAEEPRSCIGSSRHRAASKEQRVCVGGGNTVCWWLMLWGTGFWPPSADVATLCCAAREPGSAWAQWDLLLGV